MQKPIRMKFDMAGGKEGIVPEGIKFTLVIDVKDGIASFRFDKAEWTKQFYLSQKAEGKDCEYFERVQACLVKYPNMTQQEIVKDISQTIKSKEKK